MNKTRSSFQLAISGSVMLTLATGFALPAHNTALIAHAGSLPDVKILGVLVNNSSAKIEYAPVPGARDYRVYDTAQPSIVKYAGLRAWSVPQMCTCHFALEPDGKTPLFPLRTVPNSPLLSQPTTIYGPNTEIEWNMLYDGQSHTLRVEALNRLGPMPPSSAAKVTLPNGVLSAAPMGSHYAMIGANEGVTSHGMTSINGQGPSTNAPGVIARSKIFAVQANPTLLPIPSRPGATQTFLDTFDNSEINSLHRQPTAPLSPDVLYTLNEGTQRASTIEVHTDITSTRAATVMIDAGHLMDIVPNAGGSGIHTTFMPVPIADFGNGQMLHATMEVDAPSSGNRWTEIRIQPALDSGRGDFTARFTQRNTEVEATVLVPGSTDKYKAFTTESNREGMHWGGNGLGIDDRSRFDLFLTSRHFAIFEDGQIISQGHFPYPLTFSVAHLQYRHFYYHSDLATTLITQGLGAFKTSEQDQLRYDPWNVAQVSDYPFTDERHWDNIGFEVLPSSAIPTHWYALASLIHMPHLTAPTAPDMSMKVQPKPQPTMMPGHM